MKTHSYEWETEFDKQNFCWTDDFDNKRKLHTNRDITDEVKAFIHTEIDKAVAEKDLEIKSIVSFLTSAYFSVYYFYDETPPASQKTHDDLRKKILGYVEKYLSPKK